MKEKHAKDGENEWKSLFLVDSMDYQWGNQNILFIIDKNNIIDRKTDQKALKDYWNLLISYSS